MICVSPSLSTGPPYPLCVPHSPNTDRYTILAAAAVPKGFVDAKQVAEKVLEAINLEANDFRFGHTKASNPHTTSLSWVWRVFLALGVANE